MIITRRVIWSLCLLFLLSCTDRNSNLVLLKHEDFGPQVVAHEILGMDWWQWQSHGDSKPRKYDIKVVVYKDIDISEVKKLFPVDPDLLQDYRYVNYSVAIDYLDKVIEENVLESVTTKLVDTKAGIQAALQ